VQFKITSKILLYSVYGSDFRLQGRLGHKNHSLLWWEVRCLLSVILQIALSSLHFCCCVKRQKQ